MYSISCFSMLSLDTPTVKAFYHKTCTVYEFFKTCSDWKKSLFAKFSIHKNQSTVQDFFKIVFLLKTGLNFLSVKTNSTVYDFFINFFCFLKKAGNLFYLKNKSSKIITIFLAILIRGKFSNLQL